MMNDQIFVNPAKAAAMLSVSRSTLYQLVKDRRLNLTKAGRRSLVRVSDLVAMGQPSSEGTNNLAA